MKKTIALVAHNNMKIAMAEWANMNKNTLKKFNLVGTEGTASIVRNIAGLNISDLGHGPAGGDIVIAHNVLEGKIDYLFFFIDVETPHGHEHEIQTLIRISVIKNIAIALNPTTGTLLINSLEKMETVKIKTW
ncbi:MAG: methylglyoxal synthase [Candidatus Cloacimonadota bacterium]|nr:methylglyoxal synthase [Candidatus Cloacimonadota bacterium]